MEEESSSFKMAMFIQENLMRIKYTDMGPIITRMEIFMKDIFSMAKKMAQESCV